MVVRAPRFPSKVVRSVGNIHDGNPTNSGQTRSVWRNYRFANRRVGVPFMRQNGSGVRPSTWPISPSIRRPETLKQNLSLKVFAKGTALLIIIPFLLIFTGGHSVLTWVMGIVTLIVAVLIYVAAVLLHRDLRGLDSGIEKNTSVYVLPIKRGS